MLSTNLSLTQAYIITTPAQQIRRGPCTAKKGVYAGQVVHDLHSGYLNVPAGTTFELKYNLYIGNLKRKGGGFHSSIRYSSNAAF